MLSRRRRLISLWLLVLVGITLVKPTSAQAQGDPAAQCKQGVQLSRERRASEALPLLEAGFAGRNQATFTGSDDMALCALALGRLRKDQGDAVGALAAYSVALESSRSSSNRSLQAVVLNNTGVVYQQQRRFGEALDSYQQALAITREMGDRAGEGAALSNIGGTYESQGRYGEALEACQQALALAREVGNQTGEGAALSIIGTVYKGQRRYDEALEAFQQALAIRREMGDQTREGETLTGIGLVYQRQGRQDEALEVYQQALAIWRAVGNRAGEGATLNNIGGVYWGQGRHSEAMDSYQQALAILHEVGDRPGEGTTLNGIGMVYENQGRYDKALESYQQALIILREIGDRTGEGTTLNGIGGVYDSQGRYAEALEMFQRALAIRREVNDRTGEGATLNNIGGVYWGQGRYGEALEAYQQALAIAREVGDRASESSALNNIGLVYHQQGRYAEALEVYQQTLAIRREIGDRAGEGTTLNGIGGVYDSERRYAEALDTYQQALAILREVSNRAVEGATLNNIGSVYRRQGRYAEALDTLQRALAIRREVGDRAGESTTLYNIGYLHEQQSQGGEALIYYEQAMTALEALRAIAGSEAGRAAFIAQYAGLYHSAVRLYHEQRQDEQAFQTSERGRARTFLDAVSSGHVELSDNQAAELLAREQETYAQWQGLQDTLARARGAAPPGPALVADLESQLTAAANAHTAVLDAIQERGDQLSALVPGPSGVLSLAEIQALLDEDTTLIAYYLLGDAGSLAFVIRAGDMRVVELPDATPQNLQGTVTDLHLWRSTQNPHPAPLRDLYAWLVTPLAEHLIGRRLIVVPHQHLHYVPFSALSDGEGYLSERFELAILPSASSLRFIQQNASAPDSRTPPSVFGNPTSDVPELPSLEHASQEAEAVAGLLRVSAYLGNKATEAQLRLASAGAKVVHLAAHGGYNAANPLYSTIYLAPGDGQDGRLETHEVYGLDLKGNDLVVLSACETNIGDLSAGDEVVGLTRAFFFAGAPTVVASLWCVDDAATGALMTAFYRHWLQDGMSKAQALQAAQADVRSDPRWASPFYWAGFVLNGDPGKPQQPSRSPSPQSKSPAKELETRLSFVAPAIAGFTAIAVAVVWMIRRRRTR